VISRVQAQYMEPRGAIGTYDAGEDRYTLYADVNYPHRVRNMLASMVFRVPESKVRVVCHDVGGGFGAKGWQYVEPANPVGGKEAQPTRQMELRALRGHPRRRARARQYRRDRTRLRHNANIGATPA
jgi:CO/xanthine dehydrogenase Mo-binding subunit